MDPFKIKIGSVVYRMTIKLAKLPSRAPAFAGADPDPETPREPGSGLVRNVVSGFNLKKMQPLMLYSLMEMLEEKFNSIAYNIKKICQVTVLIRW